MDFFDSFLKKHNIVLPENVYQACMDGLHYMSNGKDGIHTHLHVKDLLTLLDEFLADQQNHHLKPKIDFKVMLLSIVWHDTWKSQQITSNPFKLFFNQVAEGLASMRIFSRNSRKYGLDKITVKKVKYAIRKHSELQLLPLRGLEAKLLYNLDTLELFSAPRLRNAVEALTSQRRISPLATRLVNLYLRYYKYPKSHLTFMPWAKIRLKQAKPDFFAESKRLIREVLTPGSK